MTFNLLNLFDTDCFTHSVFVSESHSRSQISANILLLYLKEYVYFTI